MPDPSESAPDGLPDGSAAWRLVISAEGVRFDGNQQFDGKVSVTADGIEIAFGNNALAPAPRKSWLERRLSDFVYPLVVGIIVLVLTAIFGL